MLPGRGLSLPIQLLLEAKSCVLLVLGLVPEVEALAEPVIGPHEVEAILPLVDEDLPLGQRLQGGSFSEVSTRRTSNPAATRPCSFARA